MHFPTVSSRRLVDQLAALEAAAMATPWSMDQIEGELNSPWSAILLINASGIVERAAPPEACGAEPAGYALLRAPATSVPAQETAAEGGAPVTVLAPPEEPAELLRIGVLPALRRIGLAKAILAKAEELAFGRAARLILEVSSQNTSALALYRGRGFVEIHRRPGYYRDGSDAVIMEKRSPARQSPPPGGSIL